MKMKPLGKWPFLMLLFALLVTSPNAQVLNPPVKAAKSVIFAVLNDGTSLEPIAHINKGKLEAPANGSDEENIVTAFNKVYYKPGTVYKLIFGSANAGTVTVKNANAKSECGKNIAVATTKANKTPIKGLVMALATNAALKSTAAGVRRKPIPAEKEEMDGLVRAQYLKEKVTPRVLRFQNLTALDLDNDGTVEFVGSYWVEINKLTRGLLFFIANKDSNAKYSMGYSEYRSVDQASVMSREIKDVDEGVYHEMLLDAFDYDGDGVAEVFTYQQSFEGAGFNAYHRSGGKWTRDYEFANYHCGY